MTDTNTYYVFHETMKNMPDMRGRERDVLKQIADNKGIPFVHAAHQANVSGFVYANDWPKVDMEGIFTESGYSVFNLISIFKNDTFCKCVTKIADELFFPRNSAMLHAMSCIASAMTIKGYKYRADRWVGPVNLYTMVIQPPSMAKSTLNSRFSDVIEEYVTGELADEIKVERKKISIELKILQKEAKQATGQEQASIEYDIEELQEQLSGMAKPVYKITDATPEALQVQSSKQGNWWCINTAEQGLIDKVFGLGYGDGKKADLDFILQSWGHEKSVVLRITRDKVETSSVGNVGMVIQNAGAESLLRIGENGQGLPERFFMAKEKSTLGSRKKANKPEYPEKEIDWYESMIREILHGDKGVEIEFDQECRQMIADQMQDYEPHMGEGGKYSSTLLQGMIGKADAQIYRIASIIHIFRSFKKGRKFPVKVEPKTVFDAIAAYEQLKESNIQVTTSTGHAGDKAIKKAIINALIDLHERKKIKDGRITLAKFRDLKKGGKPFNGYEKVTMILRQSFTELASDGVVSFHDDEIWINPNILN